MTRHFIRTFMFALLVITLFAVWFGTMAYAFLSGYPVVGVIYLMVSLSLLIAAVDTWA